jgi:hypothetical protein
VVEVLLIDALQVSVKARSFQLATVSFIFRGLDPIKDDENRSDAKSDSKQSEREFDHDNDGKDLVVVEHDGPFIGFISIHVFCARQNLNPRGNGLGLLELLLVVEQAELVSDESGHGGHTDEGENDDDGFLQHDGFFLLKWKGSIPMRVFLAKAKIE